MELSPLEIVLLTGLVMLVTGVAVRMWMGGRYVTKAQYLSDQCSYREKFDILFQMVRSLVAYSNVPPEEMRNILNAKGGRQ